MQSILDGYVLKQGEDSQPKLANRKKKNKNAAEGSAARKKGSLFAMLANPDDDEDDEADEDFACGGKGTKKVQKPQVRAKAGAGLKEPKSNKKALSADAEAEMLVLGDDDDAKNITKDVIITDNFQQKNNFYFYENSKSVVCFVRGTGEQDGWKCDTAWFWWSQSFVVVYVVVGVRVERSDQNAKEDTNEKDGNGNNVYLLQNIFIVLAGCSRASIVVIS
jgi:hypothetical protein